MLFYYLPTLLETVLGNVNQIVIFLQKAEFICNVLLDIDGLMQ